MKTIYHYGQQINSGGRFQMYDYGKIRNLRIYNQTESPEYPVEKIIVPFYLMYSDNDWFGTTNVQKLIKSNNWFVDFFEF